MSESYLNTRLGVSGKAWQEGKTPITRFCTDDDGVVMGLPFHHISKTYEDPVLKALLIWYPVGIVEIRGPEVGEFHAQLTQGNIDLVRANGEGIVTVVFHPADETDDDTLIDADEPTEVAHSRRSKGDGKSVG